MNDENAVVILFNQISYKNKWHISFYAFYIVNLFSL